ncbi:MAG TPA: RNA polymerase sigma factor, partial [Kineosporiaceae bacterium]|nr:RNA polymerase sigma factor [Kineosporiaceae bacterium]
MSESRERFPEVYQRTYADLVRFVVRRGYPPSEAEDLVAEVFTVAWRRVDELPSELDESRAWLFGITRRLLLAHYRVSARGQALSIRIAEHNSVSELPGHDDLVAVSVDLVEAWRKLSAAHQEALSLAIWEGLNSSEAARLLRISPVAFRIRL